MDIPQHIVPYLKKAFDGLEEPLTKFLERSTPDWLIYDFAPFWLPPISSKLGILCIRFCIYSATGFSFILNSTQSKASDTIDESCRVFHERLLPKETEFCVSDSFRAHETFCGADIIAIRSCMEIEGESINSIRNLLKKPVVPVGLLPSSVDVTEDENWNTICKWLDEQEKWSVIYVAFGSELKILAHKSVGGFLSHSGWSSVNESLQFGCPLIMLPFHNEQGLVARLMEEKMVGIRVPRNEHDGKFSRDSLAKALRSVMLCWKMKGRVVEVMLRK
ncbi:hypothetical protein PIB30_034838 [Stylosanthes scabra]|uniref:Uncharacterized protein n=1 Tax=Stylosanthes scabra TaxID=79078 RepID=A0ABU6XEP3_9FABA|nr:hypothetical protein [Stylosanthes scabra]